MRHLLILFSLNLIPFILLGGNRDSVITEHEGIKDESYHHRLQDVLTEEGGNSGLTIPEANMTPAEKFRFQKGIASALNNIGKFYRDNGKHDVAIEYHLKALKISKEINDGPEVARAFLNIGLVLDEQGMKEKSLDFYQESVSISEEINEPLGKAIAYNNIGCIHYQLKNYDKALDTFKEALFARQQIDDENGMAAAMNNIAVTYKAINNYKNALDYFSKALNIFKKNQEEQDYSLVLLHMGDIYDFYKEYTKANVFYQEALHSAKKSRVTKRIVEAYQKLSALEARRENYKNAFQFEKLSIAYKDSLFSERIAKQIAEQAVRVELDKVQKEFQLVISKKEVEMLSQQARISELELKTKEYQSYLFIVGFVLFGAMAMVMYVRYNGKKKLNNKLEEHNHTVLSQNVELQRMFAKLASSENELRKLNTTKDKFFSIISHDLRSPLNTLSGFLHIIRNDVNNLSQAEIKNLTGQIERSIRNLLGLLDNLLKWSLSQMGSIDYTPETISVHNLIMENVSLLEPNAKAKEIQIEVKVGTNVYAQADVNMLNLVVRNVLSNAIKFTKTRGEIKIRAIELNDQVKIFIEDNGIGISKEDQPKLFVLGSPISSGTSNEKGTGLGLFLCKEFMEKNGGSIEIESEVNQGAVFTLRLPKSELVKAEKTV